jgi:hypothetical protein
VVADGEDPPLRDAALGALADRYDAYARRPPDGALIVVDVHRWSGWSAIP